MKFTQIWILSTISFLHQDKYQNHTKELKLLYTSKILSKRQTRRRADSSRWQFAG